MTFKERVCKLFWQKKNNSLFLPLFVALEKEATLSLEEKVYIDPGPWDCELPEGRAIGLAPRSSPCPRSWVQIGLNTDWPGRQEEKASFVEGFS